MAERAVGPLTGVLPIGNSLCGQARLSVMMGQHLRLGLDDVGEVLLEQLSNLLMIVLAGTLQQRRIGHVLDQGMLNSTLSELESGGAVLLQEGQGNDFPNRFTPQPFADPAMNLGQGQPPPVRPRGKKRPAAARLRPAGPASASPARPEN